jgi:acyl-CoA synthetase (AMP-forming)/AMP-acid ligase II
VILEYAAALAGLVLVTVNPAFGSAELAYVLNQSGAAGIFLVPEFRSPMAKFLEVARPEVPALREVVFFTAWQEFLDGRGYLRIEGRIKDMIIRGGENVYPREIEDALFAHPAVAEAVVIGVPDQTWGEVVAAYVRPVPGQSAPDPEELRAWCRKRLAPYKTPLYWVFVDAFPMTPSGKIQKFKLREGFTQNQPV